MDIHILHDGTQIGPFPEDAVQSLLKQGKVMLNDLAWSPGLPQWVPLMNLLYPSATPPPPPEGFGAVPPAPPTVPPAPEPAVPLEPATAKQTALLSYLGINYAPDLGREAALRLINEAVEQNPGRFAKWNNDRLRLHPALYAEEIQQRKENRSQQFLDICQAEGAEYFNKVTKAHCQVLVGYLDVKFPNWDANEHDAIWNYFFPAIAEKFPQLLLPGVKGRFKYPEGPKVSPELKRGSPVSVKARHSSGSPLMAVARGLFFGALILVLLWFVHGIMNRPTGKVSKSATPAPAAAGQEVAQTAPPESEPVPLAGNVTPAESPEPAPLPLEPAPMPADTGVAVAPMPPVLEPAPEPAQPAGEPEPAPPLPAGAPVIAVPPPPPTLMLTKPFEIQLAYGKIKLPPGTQLKFVQLNGSYLTVKYLRDTVSVPADSTNFASLPASSLAPAPSTSAPASTTAPPPAAPPPLFLDPPPVVPSTPAPDNAPSPE